MSAAVPNRPITRADIEARLRALRGDVDERVTSARGTLTKVGVVAGVLVVLLAFFMGVRRGKKKTTVVEIRRV